MTAPSAGARFVLERRAVSAGAFAVYDASIATAEVTYRADATLHDDGTVELFAVGEPAPAALMEKLTMFAKLTARSAPSRRAEGVPVWPARVTRWRPL
jgi:hypothetical protein